MQHGDQKRHWLDEEIWPEIHSMMHSDGYFKLWLKAQGIAKMPYGPIAQTIINGYATYQLAAVRRICDRRTQDDVISLPKLLELIKHEQPYRATIIDGLVSRLKTECDELYKLATQGSAGGGHRQTATERSMIYQALCHLCSRDRRGRD